MKMTLMKEKILINCGDSWPNGDYCWIDADRVDYEDTWDRSFSYCNILSKYFNFDKVETICCGEHSNDQQFFNFKNFMNGNWDYYSKNNTHVLWGTTSLTRYFLNFKTRYLSKEDKNFYRFQKQYLSDDFQLACLITEFNTVRELCNAYGITLTVYNTFNHYDIPHALFNGVDLLSLLTDSFDKSHRESNWKDNDEKTNYAVQKGFLDPKTKHPSRQGSKKIASIMIQELLDVYSQN